jgi:hypothetical protein
MIMSMKRLDPHSFYPVVWIAKHGNNYRGVLWHFRQILLLEPVFEPFVRVGHLEEDNGS